MNFLPRKSQGKFVVTRADVDNSPPAQAFMFSFSATKLAKKDGPFQKSDPFLMIYKKSQIVIIIFDFINFIKNN